MKFRFVNVLWNNPHTPERFRLRSFHISIIYFILYFKPAAHDRQVVMTVWCVTPGCLSSIEYFHSSCFSHDRKIRFQDRPSLFVFREKKKKISPKSIEISELFSPSHWVSVLSQITIFISPCTKKKNHVVRFQFYFFSFIRTSQPLSSLLEIKTPPAC